MANAAKIAVTVDKKLLQRAEKLRRETGEARSALVARALRRLLGEEETRQKIEQYVAAYRKHPETRKEILAARTHAVAALKNLEWIDE